MKIPSAPLVAAWYVAAFTLSMVATLWLTPIAGRVARRLDLMDNPSDSKIHKQPTPYLGGMAVAGGLVLVAGVAAGASGQLLTVLLGGLAVAVLGLADDSNAVGPWAKLLFEMAAGFALWMAGVRATLFDVTALDLFVTVLWVVAITNAVNLLDNMDGVSSGTTAIAALTFFALAAERGDYLVGSFALALAGASLGFLRHNLPPAKIFLGDAGSLLAGFLLASLGLKLDLIGKGHVVRAAIPVLILAVPIFDTMLVMVARLRDRRPMFRGGTDHSSHRMSRLGFSDRSVAIVAYGLQVACCGLAVWLLHTSSLTAMEVVGGVAILWVALLIFLLSVREIPPSPAEVGQTALPPATLDSPVIERL